MLRSTILALLATAVVYGQRCDDEEIKVDSDSDLQPYAERCTTLKGSVIFGKNIKTPDFGQIRKIEGDVVAEEAVDCTSITGASLTEIGGTLQLIGMTLLTALNLANLEKVDGLYIQTAPRLNRFGFNINSANSIVVSDTVLTTLDGIDVNRVSLFDINNNRYLKEVNVGVTTVSEALSITFNAKSVQVSFPDLIWSNNCTFRDVGSVLLPSLEAVNGSIGFINSTFESFSAPNLTTVGEAVAFVDCNRLTNASFPELSEIGGTLLFANSTINEITGFPKLESIDGAVDMSGSFDTVELPSLTDVRGGFNIQTTSKFDCGPWDKAADDGLIQGEYLCSAEVEEGQTGGLGTDPKKKNGAGQVAANFVALVACTIFSITYVL